MRWTPAGGEDGDVAVLEEDDVAGVVEDAGDVGGEEVFAVADADDGGRAEAGGDEFVGFAGGEDADGEGAGEALDGAADGFFEGRWRPGVGASASMMASALLASSGRSAAGGRGLAGGFVELVFDEVGDDFGVGFG